MTQYVDYSCSLSATFFRNRVIGMLRSSEDPHLIDVAKRISQNFIFEHPTLNELAVVLAEAVGSSSSGDQLESTTAVLAQDIEALVAKYATKPTHHVVADKMSDQIVVLLTGSTGNIGSHILSYLLADDRISRVYTLNRPSSDPDERLRSAFRERLLPTELLEQPKLKSLVGDITKGFFGLDPSIWNEVRRPRSYLLFNQLAACIRFQPQLLISSTMLGPSTSTSPCNLSKIKLLGSEALSNYPRPWADPLGSYAPRRSVWQVDGTLLGVLYPKQSFQMPLRRQ